MNIIYGAGVVGEAVLYACRYNNIKVGCFCDDNTNITGRNLCDIPIINTLSVIQDKKTPHHFIIATTEIQDVINKIQVNKLATWENCIKLLNHFDVYAHTFSKKIDFARYVIDACISCHKAHQCPNKLFIRSVDLVITEKCSLKCKDCSNLMQYYKKPHGYLTRFLYDSIDRLCEIADEIHECRIIGGEPLLHKEHHKIVERVLSKPNVNKVIIYTNGTINIPPSKIQPYKNNKVVFFITDYGKLSKQIQQLQQTLMQNNIMYYINPVGGWTDCSKIVSHNNGLELFKNCCSKNTFTLLNGMFYRCPFSANAMHLGLIKDYITDFCDIFSNTKESLQSFLYSTNTTGVQSCNNCNGRVYGTKEIIPAIQNIKKNG